MADKRESLSDARPIQATSTAAAAQGAPPSQPVVYAVPVYSPSQEQQQQAYVQPPSATVVTTVPQATVVTLVQTGSRSFGPDPARVICPFCGADVITGVRITPSLTAHLWALGLCVFGCWPCCVVPYFVNDCQSHVHICPNCNHEIGFHGL